MKIQSPLPGPFSPSDVARHRSVWAGETSEALRPWLEAVFGNSPYLTRLLLLHPEILQDVVSRGPETAYASLQNFSRGDSGQKELMRALRIMKGKLALLVALCDMGGLWSLRQVTEALSDFAEESLKQAMDYLLAEAQRRGEIDRSTPHDSGIAVLAMGKLGARELNYSSDIDLMIFFERGRLGYKGPQSEQHFMNRLAHELVRIMQDRTEEGYVFRTDLRLRPDPASTPPAISIDAAYAYYESVGQNWERAAMIKARPVAGDLQAGERFLQGIAPFMWRRSLDFAAINDIHSIKRQMDTRQSKAIRAKGHNIKLGLGGIREIEFYAQIHQLIWGGREPGLRLRGTCDTLEKLVELKLVETQKGKTMRDAYRFLRTLEHRLQMIADEQTHSLPESDEGLRHVACFMGFGSAQEFSDALLEHLNAAHAIYASSFKSAEQLGETGNLVFTGVSHDPDTLETLRGMGYLHPETVSDIVMGWHHGNTRATRTTRARELLTELMPILLGRLSETANPDAAFLKFDEFLSRLPSGVQIFSLFGMNPELLGLIADIMGSAPTLAEHLSKSPALLDAVLHADFYASLPVRETLAAQLRDMLAQDKDFEARMNGLRRFHNEKQFQAGVQLLKGMIAEQEAGRFLSDLADVLLQEAYGAVRDEFVKAYGAMPGGRFAVIALGKLGSREMTFGSDIDLVFVYDAPEDALSDGEKGHSPSVYYNRLAQRFLTALTAMGKDGKLYETDTRLRPAGNQGLLATGMQGLQHYFTELAWTFEYMAFTKARVVVSDTHLKNRLDDFIIRQMGKPRDADKLRRDVIDMRTRVEKEFPASGPWDIKYVRGGQMDLDFLAQYLLLLHALPMTGSAAQILHRLKESKRIEAGLADELLAADAFLGQIFHMLRLCGEARAEEFIPPGLKKLLCEALKEEDFEALKERLLKVEAMVLAHYNAFLS